MSRIHIFYHENADGKKWTREVKEEDLTEPDYRLMLGDLILHFDRVSARTQKEFLKLINDRI